MRYFGLRACRFNLQSFQRCHVSLWFLLVQWPRPSLAIYSISMRTSTSICISITITINRLILIGIVAIIVILVTNKTLRNRQHSLLLLCINNPLSPLLASFYVLLLELL